MKIIIKLLRKAIFALSVVYGFNIIMKPVGMFIPLNAYTIICLAIFGFPGALLLIGLNAII